jgi:hypothetical protein
MSLSRRRFLQTGAVAVVAATVISNPLQSFAQTVVDGRAGAPYFPVPDAVRLDSAVYLQKVAFTPYVGTQFRVQGGGKGGLLTLTQVDDLRGNGKTAAAGNGFSLVFAGSLKKPLAQNTYTFTHDALGEFSLLLVRLNTRKQDRAYYEAIINRVNL